MSNQENFHRVKEAIRQAVSDLFSRMIASEADLNLVDQAEIFRRSFNARLHKLKTQVRS